MSKLILKEEVDFKWLEKDTPYGPITTFPQLSDGTILKRVKVPRNGSTVMLSHNDELRPVKIISGEFEVNGRVSNFWRWYEMNEHKTLVESNQGYGFFYETPPNF